jgi:hypothetical protein
MTADTSLRPTYWPRGLVISSGEDVPGGQSLRARMLIEQIGPGDIDVKKLTELQVAAREGLLAEAMAGYVKWIAGHADSDEKKLRERLLERQVELRNRVKGDYHRRTPDITASLAIGAQAFFDFAVHVGAMERAEPRFEAVWNALLASAEGQQDEQRQADPVVVFLEAVPALLAAGKAHFADRNGELPSDFDPVALGWRRKSTMHENDIGPTHLPCGTCIGWVEDDELWLIPDAAIAAVDALLREQGQGIAITKSTLGKRLWDSGKLKERGTDGRPTALKKIGGVTQRVYVLAQDTVLSEAEETHPVDDAECPPF